MSKTFVITLSEDECVALANLHTTLIENQEQLEGLQDQVDGTVGTVWEFVENRLPALRALIGQLPL